MMNVVALDDEPPALTMLETYCRQSGRVQLGGVFTSITDAAQYITKNTVDLLFLDINMPAISGLEFYKTLPIQPLVVFTTAYPEYAVESYTLNAVDYLLKPYTFERFQQALDKAGIAYQYQQQHAAEKYLILRVDYSLVRIALSKILYIEGLDNYVRIHMQGQHPMLVRTTLKNIQDQLPEDFIRVHRSYIVPLSKVDSVRNKTISIADKEVPLSNSYEKAFTGIFNARKS
jgi:DNA-binding LytR/AlgR family response regulator